MSDELLAVRAHYQALIAKVDAFFARVQQRHGGDMQCGSGCHDCCLVDLTVTGIEADAIRQHLDGLPALTRQRLRERAQSAPPGRCAALADDGLCDIYPSRPLVCRSHGLPLRLRPAGGLPVIDACPRNFADQGAAAAAPDCVLDQDTLSTLLLTVAGLHARATGGDVLARTALRDLLA